MLLPCLVQEPRSRARSRCSTQGWVIASPPRHRHRCQSASGQRILGDTWRNSRHSLFARGKKYHGMMHYAMVSPHHNGLCYILCKHKCVRRSFYRVSLSSSSFRAPLFRRAACPQSARGVLGPGALLGEKGDALRGLAVVAVCPFGAV